MPKLSKDFPARLSLDVTEGMRLSLIAIGYMTGGGGEYATPARNFLNNAIQRYIDGLTDRQKQEYAEILENVRIRETKKLPSENQKAPG